MDLSNNTTLVLVITLIGIIVALSEGYKTKSNNEIAKIAMMNGFQQCKVDSEIIWSKECAK